MWMLIFAMQSAFAGYGDAVDGLPSVQERALHVWTNAMRMAPGAFADAYSCRFADFKAGEKSPQPALGMDLRLYAAARLHSNNMADQGFFEHTDPFTGKDPFDRIGDEGYPMWTAGENIAQGAPTARDAALGWMCSSGHRANIMHGDFFELGTGHAVGGGFGADLWTQNFGSRTQERDVPALPAGMHEARGANTLLLVNVDARSVPDEVRAVVDGESAPMQLGSGAEDRGTWRVTVSAGEGCHLYWFEADIAGDVARFPEEGSYAFGCADDEVDDADAMWASAATTTDALGGTTLAAVLLGITLLSAVIAGLICRFSFRDPRKVAHQIEQKFPDLEQRLLTALSQEDEQLGYLQRRVIGEAKQHSRAYRWTDAVPTGQLAWSRLSGASAFLLLAVILTMLAVSEAAIEAETASRIERSADVEIFPGNTEVERGTSLVVTAKFDGWVPDEAELVCESTDGSQRRYTMTQNLKDPVIGAFISAVDQTFQYRIETDDWQSDAFEVSVFEFPALVRSDANLKYPEYTGLTEKRVEDTVRISAVEGTEVTWLCFLNKDVTSADLVAEDGTRITLQPDADEPDAMSAKLDLQTTQRLKLELVDQAGRNNKYPPELIARVLPNQPPSLKLTIGGDVSVSPLEELPLGATVRDDFGVAKMGLSYTYGTNSPQDILLGEELPRGAQTKVDHLVEFEALQAEPDELFVYHFWAEDFGPDGEVRRTESDMFFAEVRPFEEIFREGEQPPGGQQQQQQQQQSQNGQQAQELAELQKEIINATWRVIRDQRPGKQTSTFVDDVGVIEESQATALQQLEELAGEIQDERSTAFVDVVREQMLRAIN